jgi:hypothetical protein
MAATGKSAVAYGTYEGDVHSHVFRIEVDASAEWTYDEDSKTFAYPFIPITFACLPCHDTEDAAWAETNGTDIHNLK